MVAVAAGCSKALDYFSAFLHKRVQKTLLTIDCSLISGCGQGCKGFVGEAVAQFSRANSQQKWKYR